MLRTARKKVKDTTEAASLVDSGVASTGLKVEPLKAELSDQVEPASDQIKSVVDQPQSFKVEEVAPPLQVHTDLPSTEVSNTDSSVEVGVNTAGDLPQQTGRSDSKMFKLVLFFVAGLILGGSISGSIFYFKLRMDNLNSKQVGETAEIVEELAPDSTVVPTQSVTSEASSSANLKLSSYKLAVLNGSGISGKAASVKNKLVLLGFSDVKTGNADNSGYTDTEISLKKNIPDTVYDVINKSLSTGLKITRVKEPLEDSSQYDVLIIAGSSQK